MDLECRFSHTFEFVDFYFASNRLKFVGRLIVYDDEGVPGKGQVPNDVKTN